MQFNQTYVPNEASVQMNKPMDQIHNNQVLQQNCSTIPDCPAAWETLLQRKRVEKQFNQTYVPNEASVQVNNPIEQIYNNQVLLQNCPAIPNCPAAWETLLQRRSVEKQFNQTYVPNEASVQVNKPMEQIYNNQVLLQNCPAIANCPAAWETLPQRESVKMQFDQTYAPDKASVQVNKPVDPIHYNQVLLQNCSAIPDCAAAWETPLHRESAEQFQQETEQTINNGYLYSKGHRSTRMPSTKRREKNRERERIRQTRLKGAFNVLRSVIPDYISEREPGDRLSRIQTLRLAKKYIATLHELLETS